MKKYHCTVFVKGKVFTSLTVEAVNYSKAHFIIGEKIHKNFDLGNHTLTIIEVK